MMQTGRGIRIEGLAAETGVSTRNIRAYQSLGLLPPPTLSGRVGLYGPEHAERLRAIARLQQRGFSLAGVRELLQALETGRSLAELIGLPTPPTSGLARAQNLKQANILEDWPAGSFDLLPGPFAAQHAAVQN